MINKNKNAPARTHGEGEYLLTTKLFCGHCKEMMVGYGGTSKTGRQYHYYMCKNARRKKCGKKIVSKSYIEDRVVNECLKMLTEEKIRFIAKKVAEECAKSPDNLTAKALKKAIREADTAIENLWKAIEQGQAVEMLTEAQILAFLDYVCEMPADDVNKRRAIINIFVHSIYLYDDHFTLIINASKKPLSIDNIPLDDIEEAFEGKNTETEGCSSLMTPAPPRGITRTFLLCRRLFRHNMVQVIPTEKNGYSHLLRVSVLSLCPADCPRTVRGQSADSLRTVTECSYFHLPFSKIFAIFNCGYRLSFGYRLPVPRGKLVTNRKMYSWVCRCRRGYESTAHRI